jgi:hypothetical protein
MATPVKIDTLNLYVKVAANGLEVEEVDNATFITLCCQPSSIEGKRTLREADLRYVGDRSIPRSDMRDAVVTYLNWSKS